MPELVGLGAQTPDVFGKLGQLLNLRHAAAQAQMAQQDATQRKNIAAYDWQQHVGPDGVLDVQSFASDPDAPHIFGDKYVDYLEHAAVARQQGLAAIDKLRSLRTEQRRDLASFLGSLRSDQDVAEDKPGPDGRQETGPGRQKANEAVINFVKTYGADALPIAETYGPVLKHTPPGQLANSIKNIQLNALSADQQVSAQQPNLMNTGAEFLQTNPNAVINPGGGTAPGRSSNTIPTTIAPNTPLRYPGQEQDIAHNQQEVASIRTAADQAPQQRSIFRNILRLADETSTGPLVSYFQNTKIGGQIFGDNYQELGKYLEKNAIANMQAMGAPGSDARLEAASAANGSTKFNPQALKAVTQFNYATNTALEQYRRGIDKAIGTANPDYTKLADFKSKWAQNFDIDVFRIENAERDGDKKTLAALRDEILKSPGRAKELKEKRAALDALGGQ